MKQLESFFWGIISAISALFVEYILFFGYVYYKNPLGELNIGAYLSIPLFIILMAFIEESFKYLIILKRIDYLSLEKTYIINSLFVGLGFFLIELLFIYFNYQQAPAFNFISLGQIMLLHMTTAGIMGYRIAIKNPGKNSTLLTTLFITTTIHASYNLCVQNNNLYIHYLIYILLGALIIKTIYNISSISKKLAN